MKIIIDIISKKNSKEPKMILSIENVRTMTAMEFDRLDGVVTQIQSMLEGCDAEREAEII